MENHFHPQMTPDEIRTISAIGLAHLGDGVFELLVRTYLCKQGKATGRGLHRATIALVCAEAQARHAKKIMPLLTPEEVSAYKRGRNAQVHSVPSHASRADYAAATALESLIGWLYLQGQQARINELFDVIMTEEV